MCLSYGWAQGSARRSAVGPLRSATLRVRAHVTVQGAGVGKVLSYGDGRARGSHEAEATS
jgi:hypothetical protein